MTPWTIILTGVFLAMAADSSAKNDREPMYAWPLGNISLYSDVIGSRNVLHDEDQTCYSFVDGPKGLPYSVLDTQEEDNACFDVNLKGPAPLRDFMISMYVYPDKDAADISGTLLHYQSEDREIMRVRTLANTFLVSFRDEYGMSAGMMYLVNLLTPRAWNHVAIARYYENGRIVVYKDGTEMYNEDDDFSDVISFPHTGKLRIGKSDDPDNEDPFEGKFACVQMYGQVISKEHQPDTLKFCQPENWKREFEYYFKVNDGKWCIADVETSTVGSLVTMAVLSRGSLWQQFLQQNGLHDGGKNSGYLKIRSRDKSPSLNEDLIGRFNATDGKVCARLCMRVNGCMSMLVDAQDRAGIQACSLYDDTPVSFVDSPGSTFYVLVD